MKKVRLTLMIAAVVLGIGGAVATKAANHRTTVGDSYYWFSASGNPADGADYLEFGPASGEPCQGTGAACEYGYTSDQLTDGDPANGVIPGDVGSPNGGTLKHN